MNCKHTIGSVVSSDDDYDFYTSLVEVGDAPDPNDSDFTPFAFCPKCGVPIAEEVAAYAKLVDEQKSQEAKRRAEIEARPKTPVDRALLDEQVRMMFALTRIGGVRISSLLRKEPLPEGLGYNYPRTEIRPVTASEINLLKKQTKAS